MVAQLWFNLFSSTEVSLKSTSPQALVFVREDHAATDLKAARSKDFETPPYHHPKTDPGM